MHFVLCKEQQNSQKQEIFRDYGVAEAAPGFQAGWCDCVYFFLSFCSFCLLIWAFRVSFCTHEGTLEWARSRRRLIDFAGLPIRKLLYQ
jgi:hypothetical protein